MSGKTSSQNSSPAIHAAPLIVDVKSGFSNYVLAALVLIAPYLTSRFVPYFSFTKVYVLLFVIEGLPVTIGYWLLSSYLADKNNNTARRPIAEFMTFDDPALHAKFGLTTSPRIPLTTFHDSYFAGKITLKGDMLDILEQRNAWASAFMPVELFKYVVFQLFPDLLHPPSQDEEQVRDHYDRGDDFYAFFLGPRMIYTSGVINKPDIKESLEQMQDNKLALVCHKLELKPTDRVLDIGCGWGTLSAYMAKNFKCDVTGITLGKNQTLFGNNRIKDNGVDPSTARILCQDYREIGQKKFNKIVSLEMAEHVGVRNYSAFMSQVYDLLEDDGIFVLQVAGIRPHWQFEDLIWGLFMNKYIFPGADASCALNWVIGKVEGANFEVKSVDVLGVHYSATLWRWYENWKSNEEGVVAKYGIRWYKIWLYFLASAVITSRQGSVSVFQITLHKNLNAYDRVAGVKSHTSLHFTPEAQPILIV